MDLSSHVGGLPLPPYHFEPSAPLEHAAEPGPGYRRELPQALLVARLNLFIEAQRAAAQVARQIVRESGSRELVAWSRELHREKVRWCNVLSLDVKALGQRPSNAIGNLYFQSTSLPGLADRLDLFERHEAWLLRQVKLVLPRIPVNALHADLLAMLAALHRSLGAWRDLKKL